MTRGHRDRRVLAASLTLLAAAAGCSRPAQPPEAVDGVRAVRAEVRGIT